MVSSSNDEILFEWMLAHAAHAVAHLENPLFSTSLNAPTGFNLMANTSVLGLGIPLAPVTWLFGPHVSFLLAVAVGLGGTAIGWYLVLSRLVVSSRIAAVVGGALCGFAPGIVSQSSGHLHMSTQWMVPAIVWFFVRLREPGHTLRRGIGLGLCVTYQVFLGEEVLLLTALGLASFTVLYLICKPAEFRASWRPFVRGLGLAVAVAAVLLAYPLWFQFLGPQHYRGLPFASDSYWTDLSTFLNYSDQSLGHYVSAPALAPNSSEQNAFYGYLLLVLCLATVLWLWRGPLVKALGLSTVVFVLLSAGPKIVIDRNKTGIPGPYQLLRHLPSVDLAVPDRFPLVVTPLLAILLALAIDRIVAVRSGPVPVRLLGGVLVAAALLPLVPLPLRTYGVPPVPAFVSSGQWRQYVPPGRTLVPVVPTTGSQAIWVMYWSGRTDLAFNAPGGYFIGPASATDDAARWGTPDTPTSVLLDRVTQKGEVPIITDSDRMQAVADLRSYRAAVVVLGQVRYREALHQTLDRLLGPGQFISGAWVWDVRALTA
jgi:hypothetical protein